MKRLQNALMLMSDIKEGDTVVIKKSVFTSFESYCDKETDIPLHNHGIVTKSEKNHQWKHTDRFGLYSYVTFKMPNGESMSLFSRDLMKLF